MPARRIAAISVVLIALSGCVDSTSPEDVDSASPETAAASGTPSNTHGAAPPPARENQTYPSQEFELHVTFAMSGPSADAQADPQEMMHQVDVPAGANRMTLEAIWSPVVPSAARQSCMAHVGTLGEMGPMIGGRAGTSPLQLGPLEIPEGNETLVVMCMVVGDPVGGEVVQAIQIKLDFAFVQLD